MLSAMLFNFTCIWIRVIRICRPNKERGVVVLTSSMVEWPPESPNDMECLDALSWACLISFCNRSTVSL